MNDPQAGPFTCTFCGRPTSVIPMEQSRPHDYCRDTDHLGGPKVDTDYVQSQTLKLAQAFFGRIGHECGLRGISLVELGARMEMTETELGKVMARPENLRLKDMVCFSVALGVTPTI